MLNPWIPVLVQLLLGLLTIAGSGVVVQGLNSRKERRDFYRAKLEVLFLAVGEYQQLCFQSMHPWSRVTTGEMSFEQASASYEEASKDKPEYFETVEMLVSLYFSKLLPEFESCNRASQKLSGLMFKIRRASLNGDAVATHLLYDPFYEALKNFDSAIVSLKKAITVHGKELGLTKGPKE